MENGSRNKVELLNIGGHFKDEHDDFEAYVKNDSYPDYSDNSMQMGRGSPDSASVDWRSIISCQILKKTGMQGTLPITS